MSSPRGQYPPDRLEPNPIHEAEREETTAAAREISEFDYAKYDDEENR